MSFSSTLHITFSLSLSRIYTSIYALEYFVNLKGELLNPGLVCGSCWVEAEISIDISTIKHQDLHQNICVKKGDLFLPAILLLQCPLYIFFCYPFIVKFKPASNQLAVNFGGSPK